MSEDTVHNTDEDYEPDCPQCGESTDDCQCEIILENDYDEDKDDHEEPENNEEILIGSI